MSLPTVFTVATTDAKQILCVLKIYPNPTMHWGFAEEDINDWLENNARNVAMVIKNGKFYGYGSLDNWEEKYGDTYGKVYNYKEFMQMLKENGESVHKKLRGAK